MAILYAADAGAQVHRTYTRRELTVLGTVGYHCFFAPSSRYRLGVRTRGSQPRDRGSNPRSGTKTRPAFV